MLRSGALVLGHALTVLVYYGTNHPASRRIRPARVTICDAAERR